MLQDAIIDDGQRLARLNRGEQDQSAKQAGLCAIFFLGDHIAFGLGEDNVGFHPNGEIARG